MSRSEIIGAVTTILVEEFELPEEEVRPEAALIEDLGLDSLDVVDLFVALEQRYGGKRVPEEEAKKVRKVGDVYAIVESHLA